MTMNGTTGLPSSQQLEAALFTAFDILERAMLPTLVLKDTAKQMREGYELHDLRQIDIGIRKAQLTPEVLSVLRAYATDLREDSADLSFLVSGVPVVIRVIRNHYAVLSNPDVVMYKYETFLIPNPFERYYSFRHIIK